MKNLEDALAWRLTHSANLDSRNGSASKNPNWIATQLLIERQLVSSIFTTSNPDITVWGELYSQASHPCIMLIRLHLQSQSHSCNSLTITCRTVTTKNCVEFFWPKLCANPQGTTINCGVPCDTTWQHKGFLNMFGCVWPCLWREDNFLYWKHTLGIIVMRQINIWKSTLEGRITM